MNDWDWYDYEKVREFNHKRSLRMRNLVKKISEAKAKGNEQGISRLIQTSSNSRSKKRSIGKKQRNQVIAGFNGMAFP
jgi:hypothetical protein